MGKRFFAGQAARERWLWPIDHMNHMTAAIATDAASSAAKPNLIKSVAPEEKKLAASRSTPPRRVQAALHYAHVDCPD
jgi:translation elongation factor EF-Tu-like GTPase